MPVKSFGLSETATQSTDKEHWMQQALQLARLYPDEIPVGAVLVHEGRIIGQGSNQPLGRCDPTAHAEIVALRHACQSLQNYRLPAGTSLFVTLEPCTMCVGALIHARVAHVYFGAYEPRAGSLVSARQLLQPQSAAAQDRGADYYNHFFSFEGGILQPECAQVLTDFFRKKRQGRRV